MVVNGLDSEKLPICPKHLRSRVINKSPNQNLSSIKPFLLVASDIGGVSWLICMRAGDIEIILQKSLHVGHAYGGVLDQFSCATGRVPPQSLSLTFFISSFVLTGRSGVLLILIAQLTVSLNLFTSLKTPSRLANRFINRKIFAGGSPFLQYPLMMSFTVFDLLFYSY